MKGFGLEDLTKTHWREVLPLPKHLLRMKRDFQLEKIPQKATGGERGSLEKVKALKTYSIDMEIVNCRARKLVLIATSQAGGGETSLWLLNSLS